MQTGVHFYGLFCKKELWCIELTGLGTYCDVLNCMSKSCQLVCQPRAGLPFADNW